MSLALIISVLLFVGAAQGFLLSAALITLRRGNTAANKILGTLLLVFSLTIFFHTLAQFRPRFDDAVQEAWLGHTIFLLFGPLMYLYAEALTNRKFMLRLKTSIHFIPFILFISLYLLVRSFALPSGYAMALGNTMFLLMVVQMLSYLIAVLKILKNHGARMKESFSSLDRINLRWLRLLTIGQIVIWSAAFVVEIAKSDSREINFVWLLVSAFMYMIGYFGISQPEIFTMRLEEDDSHPDDEKKYVKSSLSEEQALIILKRLETLMTDERPYVDPDLTLPLLSRRMSVPVHHLSQVINQRLGKNFFEYINQYRVEEAKRLLVDPKIQNLTLAAVGFEAGFNSISSFNSIFKKMTSLTPSGYRTSAGRAKRQAT